MTNHVLYPNAPESKDLESRNKSIGVVAQARHLTRKNRNLSPQPIGSEPTGKPARLIVESSPAVPFAPEIFAHPGLHEVIVNLTAASGESISDPSVTITLPGVETLELSAPPTGPLPGNKPHHPMDEVYCSRPFRFGDRTANLRIVPSSPGLLALKSHPFSPETPDALREATIAFFYANPAEFDLKIELDAEECREEEPDCFTIARLIIPSQNAPDSTLDATQKTFSFTPNPRRTGASAFRRLPAA